MKKGVKLIAIIFGVLLLIAITVIFFLTLKDDSGRPFTLVSQEACWSYENCVKLEYNEGFDCDDFSGSDYNRCMSIYSYFNKNLDLCTEIKRVSDGEMILNCFLLSNYCIPIEDENFKFYVDAINIHEYLEFCEK